MISFEAVKEAVTVRDAAERYGIPANRAGMTCCIFHEDRTPSMKIDERFHCFGCGADGDVIDFTAQLFSLSTKVAVEKLASDFNLSCWNDKIPISQIATNHTTARRTLTQRLKTYQDINFRILCDYHHLMMDWQKQYAPKREDREWHPLYVEALQNGPRVDYLLDELMGCTAEEAKELISHHKNEIARYAGRVQEFRAGRKRVMRDVAR